MATLTKLHLVTAALQLVDERGAESLSMRSLAARVNRQVSSLYNHIHNRAELIEELRAVIVADIDTSAFTDQPWDDAIVAWSRSYLAAFSSHPNVIPLLATTPIRDESTLRMYERVVAALVRQGWPTRDAVAVMRTIEAHILGSALDIVAPDDLLSGESTPPDLPALRAALDAENIESAGARRAFEVGLDALIVGLRALHARQGGTGA
ncbi:TetR family transcriptional regulator [Microcella alkaliphila]|uniref:TetR family transcriptional regulator n=1 Tax=Microcella alkaliphila TaxID=279828 RepID=A0A4Q7TT11_9MICO|nr:TetR/AcrR family transcriptional regulator C-terminal domain-containing protein [Microcella alkaliphila]RZT63943.1 TetR family transcriptional regulator [Microcella alkaliphila]